MRKRGLAYEPFEATPAPDPEMDPGKKIPMPKYQPIFSPWPVVDGVTRRLARCQQACAVRTKIARPRHNGLWLLFRAPCGIMSRTWCENPHLLRAGL